MPGRLDGDRVLVVDDLTDTGKTAKMVRDKGGLPDRESFDRFGDDFARSTNALGRDAAKHKPDEYRAAKAHCAEVLGIAPERLALTVQRQLQSVGVDLELQQGEIVCTLERSALIHRRPGSL